MVREGLTVNMIVLNEKDEILVLKRADTDDENDDYVGYFSIPGGGVEEYETIDEGLDREIKEEIGVKIVSKEYFRSYYYVVNDNLHIRSVYFYGRIEGEIEINNESESFEWFNMEELNSIKLAFNQTEVIKDFVEFYKK